MIASSDRNALIKPIASQVATGAPAGREYGLVARSVYSMSYYLSFGAVFPTLLVINLLPMNNSGGEGFRDGACAGSQASRRVQARTAAAVTDAKEKLGDTYANTVATVSRRVEALEDAVAQRRHRQRAATT